MMGDMADWTIEQGITSEIEEPWLAEEQEAEERRLASQPRWEHGYRCHGYWLNGQRLGVVGLPHARRSGCYSWSLDYPNDFPSRESAAGESTSLRSAKRMVEAAYKKRRS